MDGIIKEFEIGKILGQTFKIAFANFVPFMLLTGIVTSPSIVLNVYVVQQTRDGELVSPFIVFVQLAMSMLVFVATGAISYGVFQQLRGRPASLADCLMVGLKRMFPVFGVALLTGLATLAGFMFCIVPGVIVYVMLYAAVPCAVVERPGVTDALRRSLELTKGYRWQIFGLLFLIGLIGWLLSVPVLLLFLSNPYSTASVVIQWLVNVFATALGAVSMALVYYHLRSIKERFDVEQIAAVFA